MSWDDILELLIRLLDPIVTYVGPHAVAFIAVAGALVTFNNNRKQRRREKRLESKVDQIMEAMGLWSAAKSQLSATSDRNSLQSSTTAIFRALVVALFTRLKAIHQFILRGVEGMSKAWIVGLLGYLAYFIKLGTGVEVPDEMIDKIAEIVLLLIPLIAMFANMKKGEKKSAEHPVDHGPAV